MATKPTVVVKKRGGFRPGAGRPPGSKTVKTREAAQRMIVEQAKWGKTGTPTDLPPGTTPLEVMIEAMRVAYKVAGPLGAMPFAEKAAPYIHAKMGSMELTPGTGPGEKAKPFKFEVEFVKPKPQPKSKD